MKRRLSHLEILFLVVPLVGGLLTWQWSTARLTLYRAFPRTVFPRQHGDDRPVRFSPDGRLFLTSNLRPLELDAEGPTFSTEVTVWDTASGRPLWTAPGGWKRGDSRRQGVEFSPDNSRVLVLDANPQVDYVDAGTPSVVSQYEAWTGTLIRQTEINGVFWARYVDGGRKILCEGYPSRIVDADSDRVLATIRDRVKHATQRQGILRWRTNADGTRAAFVRDLRPSGDSLLRLELWDMRSMKPVKGFSGPTWKPKPFERDLELSPDGKWACTTAFLEPVVDVWDMHTGRRLCRLPTSYTFQRRFAPDSRRLVVLGPRDKSAQRWEVQAFDLATFRKKWTWPVRKDTGPATKWLRVVQFSADGRFIVVTDGRDIRWLDIRTGTVTHTRSARDVVLSPDNKTMVVETQQVGFDGEWHRYESRQVLEITRVPSE